MATIEAEIKSQFEVVFCPDDWTRFKKFAECNLKEAAMLSKKDMDIDKNLKLLARNSRKRLLIGVGTEILLKAIYLKFGFAINKPIDTQRKRPFRYSDVDPSELDPNQTCKFDDLINQLHNVVQLTDRSIVERGLKIVKIFRNKEGHCVTRSHAFDPTNYEDIATSIINIYRDAFDEQLSLTFSVERNQKSVWRLIKSKTRIKGKSGQTPINSRSE